MLSETIVPLSVGADRPHIDARHVVALIALPCRHGGRGRLRHLLQLGELATPKTQATSALAAFFHRGCDVQHSQGQVHVLNWRLRYGHAGQVPDRWDRPPINKEKREKSS